MSENSSEFRRLVEARTKRDETKAAAEKAETEYRSLESELFTSMEESDQEGTRRFDLGDMGVISFTPRETSFGRIIDADQALEFFNERGTMSEMTKPKISKSKLNEMVRERLEQGKPMPPGVDFYTNRGITISKKKS